MSNLSKPRILYPVRKYMSRSPARAAASQVPGFTGKLCRRWTRTAIMMAAQAQEDSLFSPITAAADRSESTTLLVSEGSGLPRALPSPSQPAFDDGARPPPLALLAQVLESMTRIAGQEIPVFQPVRSH